MTRVAINGFGRIGRLVARAILERPDCGLELVSVNDLADAKANAWLFSRDSVHGKFPGKVETDGLVAAAFDRPADELLVAAVAIGVGGIEEVDAELAGTSDRVDRGGRVAPGHRSRHGDGRG